jgi:hypothetical protein
MTKFAFDLRGLCGLFAAALLCLVPVALIGCSSEKPLGKVQGSVTLDGAPYADAAVVFLSMDTGQGASGDIQSGGSFQLSEPLPLGSYTVYLAPKTVAESDQPTPVTIDQKVPEKYWNEAASDIKIEIQEGANTVNVELKTEAS